MILVVFAIIAIIGQVLNVALCLALDQVFNQTVGALSFVVLYMLVFAGAWLLAVRIVEGREAAASPVPAKPAAPARSVAPGNWQPSLRAR